MVVGGVRCVASPPEAWRRRVGENQLIVKLTDTANDNSFRVFDYNSGLSDNKLPEFIRVGFAVRDDRGCVGLAHVRCLVRELIFHTFEALAVSGFIYGVVDETGKGRITL